MSFEVILTKETTAKVSHIATKIADWLKQSSMNQVIYLVPDHIKFSAELEMIQQVGQLLQQPQNSYAVTKMQVYSFKRLAWYFLRDHAALQRPSLSKVGICMILQKILSEYQDELVLFNKESRHKGFIERLSAVMQEFRLGGIEIEDFSQWFEQDSYEEIDQRLKEFGIIYKHYLDYLKQDFVQSEDLLKILAEEISLMDLSNTYVVIDQSYHLNAMELEVIDALVKSCGGVEFYTTATTDAFKPKETLESSLFDSNRQLISRLLNWLMIDESKPVLKELNEENRAYHPDFLELEQYWLETSGGLETSSNRTSRKIEALQWTTYEDERQEIQETLATIKTLVDSGKYRYQDIQILSRNLEEQQTLLQPLLETYQIPYFMDLSDTMEHHPLIQVLDAIFAIQKHFWRYHDIMNLLRSEYCFWPLNRANLENKDDEEETLRDALIQYRQKLDETETIILAQGYEGKDWISSKTWNYQVENIDEDSLSSREVLVHQQLTQAQELREQIVSLLEPFYKKLDKVETTKEAITLLYQLLEKIGVTEAFLYWRNHAANIGDIQTARRQDQVWNEFLKLLEEYVYIFGDEPFDWEIFQLLLHTGFEHTHYNMAPSTLDQLTCTGIDSVRYSPKKVTFVIGLSQGVLPRMEEESGLMTDEEREYLLSKLDSGRFLHPTTIQKQSVEPFLFYKVLTSATEKLYLSMHHTDKGAKLKPSSFVERILNQYEITTQDGNQKQQERFEQGEFVTIHELFTTLLQKLRQYKFSKEEDIPSIWIALPHLLRQDKDFQQEYHTLVDSVFHLNIAKQLPKELAAELYGNHLYLSTSQVETFYKDPFSHFLQYGLNLRERREFELTAAGSGEYFHETFDQFIRKVHELKLDIRAIDAATTEGVLKEIFDSMNDDVRFQILNATPRMNWTKVLLQDTIQQTLSAALLQLQQLQVTPWKTEVVFGAKSDKKIEIPLNDTQSLFIRGKIDRIDLLETEKGYHLGIIDYKSSAQKFDINRLRYGIQLQLLTYLSVARNIVSDQFKKTVTPYGGLYMHVFQPSFNAKDLKTNADFEEARLKKYKLSGLLTNDLGVLQQVQPDFEAGDSIVLPFGVKKDGEYKASSQVYAPDDINLLMDFAFYQLKTAGERILNGENQIAPFDELKEYADSVNGKFSAISMFDATNPENNYQFLTKMPLQENLTWMRNKIDGKEE